MELNCEVKTYEWGKIGFQSTVAKLCRSFNPEFKIEETTPYAELWMGDHPSGPSKQKSTNKLLTTVIKENPHFLGEPVREAFGDHLPFLFKVLSINKPLSIQAHPSKTHAEKLHQLFPEVYKDDNHKPELAIALTPFQALCGFRPITEIQVFLREIRELRTVVGSEAAEKLITKNENSLELVKNCFTNLMNCSPDEVAQQLHQLVKKFSSMNNDKRELQLASLVELLNKQFPDDVGCFTVYFLNVINLNPMEALYLGPNVPHAYLYGDCVECMACSDNVVRAGLTPKFKDVHTLCEMLDYSSIPSQSILFQPVQEDSYCFIYKPPVLDFAVAKYDIPSNKRYKVKARISASILLVVEGFGKYDLLSLKSGTALFIPANNVIEIDCINNMLIFQALTNIGC